VTGDPGVEAGVRVACPSCGREVMQHSMIPLLRDGERGLVCVDCARQLIVAGAPARDGAARDDAAEVGSEE